MTGMNTINPMSFLKGKIITSVTGLQEGSEQVIFTLGTGDTVTLYHSSDCCESVQVIQIDGDVQDLVNSPLLLAEETTGDTPSDYKFDYEPESFTWTFYRFATVKGYVNIRWLGESNGYYSESVAVKINEQDCWGYRT